VAGVVRIRVWVVTLRGATELGEDGWHGGYSVCRSTSGFQSDGRKSGARN
jgi:hypothetical protein